jgi:sodium transport system permease protein
MPFLVLSITLVSRSLAPGVDLNPFYSLVPVTGVALLLKRLMTASLEQVPWLYFVPVLVPTMLYSWLALRWAIEQFKREEVLFREAERLDLKLWLKSLFREKEALPSAGQAWFCFFVIVAVRWLFFGSGGPGSLVVRTGVAYLAFVAAPPLFMALLLTTKPRQGLALRWPSVRDLPVAGLLAGLLLPPLVQLTLLVLRQFPVLKDMLSERQPLVGELLGLREGEGTFWWLYLVVFALMPAVWEELAFRGFMLSGLRRRFTPWTAIVISSVLFALYHMNVFQALPALLLGVVLGLLVVRSGSVWPGMLFHLLYNGLLMSVAVLPQLGYAEENVPLQWLFHPVVTVIFAVLALGLIALLGYPLWTKSQELPSPDFDRPAIIEDVRPVVESSS